MNLARSYLASTIPVRDPLAAGSIEDCDLCSSTKDCWQPVIFLIWSVSTYKVERLTLVVRRPWCSITGRSVNAFVYRHLPFPGTLDVGHRLLLQ